MGSCACGARPLSFWLADGRNLEAAPLGNTAGIPQQSKELVVGNAGNRLPVTRPDDRGQAGDLARRRCEDEGGYAKRLRQAIADERSAVYPDTGGLGGLDYRYNYHR